MGGAQAIASWQQIRILGTSRRAPGSEHVHPAPDPFERAARRVLAAPVVGGTMRVGDVMTRGVETTTPGATLQATALKMRESGVGMLPVVEDGRPIGIITDRDITVRATANGLDPTSSCVGDVMTRQVFSCIDEESVDAASGQMEQRGVRRLVVVDRYQRMVGVITLDDLSSLPLEDEAGPVVED